MISRAKAQRKPLETRQRFCAFAPLREKSCVNTYLIVSHGKQTNKGK